MDLDSLEESISLIQRLIDADSIIKHLNEQLKVKDEMILSLEQKIKAYTSNNQLKTYISSLEEQVNSLQRRVEELEIQISENKENPSSLGLSSESACPPPRNLTSLLLSPSIWSSFSSYLNEEDSFKVLVTLNTHKSDLLKNLPSLSSLIKPVKQVEPIENREIRGLLKQEHYFELTLKPLEEKIVTVMKTLLVMQKTTDILTSVSMPSEKYSSIEELVINRFTPDKTIQLLVRSASFLSNNPSKMNDWVVFVDNSFAGLLFESAKLLIDGKNIDKLKKDLVEKLKVAEEFLITLENERKELEDQLETEKSLKIHLAQRLKKVESENSKRASEIIKLREALQQSELEKIHNAKKLETMSSEFESHRKLMSSEIFRLRNHSKIITTQKTEILEAFSEFSQILNSLSFD